MIKLYHPLNFEFTECCAENRHTTTYFLRQNSSGILTMISIFTAFPAFVDFLVLYCCTVHDVRVCHLKHELKVSNAKG